jgi:hypothetical protein
MEQSKLLRTLNVLTENELKAFRKWAFEGQSKENNDIIRLFEYLSYHLPHQNDEALEKEKVFLALFPSHPYDDRIIRRIMSDLLSILKEYIILYLQKDDFQRDMTIAEFYLDRNVVEEFSHSLTDIEKKQLNIEAKTELNHYQKYHWAKNKMIESGMGQISQKKANLEPVIHALNVFYLASALRWHCLFLNNGSVHLQASTVQFSLALSILEYDKQYLSYPLIALYYQTYCLWNEFDNEEKYNELEIWIKENEQLISLDDQVTVAKCMRNYCIKKIRLGEKHFFNKFEYLVQNHFAKGFMFEMGNIAPTAFNNIITLYLRQNKIEEAKTFLEKYKSYLKDEYKESVICLASIKIDFASFNYKGVLRTSNTMEASSDLILQMEARRHRAKAFFMLEEQEALNSCLDAFRVHLNRIKTKLVGDRYKSYKLFLKYIHKLAILNFFSKQEVESLAKKISVEDDFTEKSWMLEFLSSKGAVLP